MAIRYNVKCKGKSPANGGQVLRAFAKLKGVNVDKFNENVRVSRRDYLNRIRRAKKRIYKSKLSMPTPRPAKVIKSIVKTKIETNEVNIGIKIAPKDFVLTQINADGRLTESISKIYGRKIPLKDIISREIERLNTAGVMRFRSNEAYDQLSLIEITEICKEYHIDMNNFSKAEVIDVIKKLERTRKWKMWHDHSDILNHTYINFMVSLLYDPANFLTDDEYIKKNPQKKAHTDADQFTYIDTRLDDILTLNEPSLLKREEFSDIVRVFSGDNPARQFKAGQQRGGNYSCLCGVHSKNHINFEACLKINLLDLEERRRLVLGGEVWLKIESGIFNPFGNLKNAELIEELECRNVNTDNMDRNTLKDELTELMHGVTRPPALLMKNPRISTKNLNLESYEILHNEPLHDISNVVKNIIEELPTHIENKNVQNEFEKFAAKTVGEKNQVKGSDARRFVVQLAKFITNLNEKGLISKEFVDLVFSLVEITKISYSPFNTRSPKQLLRLFNQCFLFSMLCRQIIPIPKKMTIRKFYGIHFHCITTHLPETARIFNTKAILTENEERSFGDLRRISVSTTNRKPGWIVDNAILRFNAQQSKGEKIASYQKQDSIISKQARLLPQRPDTPLKQPSNTPSRSVKSTITTTCTADLASHLPIDVDEVNEYQAFSPEIGSPTRQVLEGEVVAMAKDEDVMESILPQLLGQDLPGYCSNLNVRHAISTTKPKTDDDSSHKSFIQALSDVNTCDAEVAVKNTHKSKEADVNTCDAEVAVKNTHKSKEADVNTCDAEVAVKNIHKNKEADVNTCDAEVEVKNIRKRKEADVSTCVAEVEVKNIHKNKEADVNTCDAEVEVKNIRKRKEADVNKCDAEVTVKNTNKRRSYNNENYFKNTEKGGLQSITLKDDSVEINLLLWRQYTENNVKSVEGYRTYADFIPKFLHSRFTKFVKTAFQECHHQFQKFHWKTLRCWRLGIYCSECFLCRSCLKKSMMPKEQVFEPVVAAFNTMLQCVNGLQKSVDTLMTERLYDNSKPYNLHQWYKSSNMAPSIQNTPEALHHGLNRTGVRSDDFTNVDIVYTGLPKKNRKRIFYFREYVTREEFKELHKEYKSFRERIIILKESPEPTAEHVAEVESLSRHTTSTDHLFNGKSYNQMSDSESFRSCSSVGSEEERSGDGDFQPGVGIQPFDLTLLDTATNKRRDRREYLPRKDLMR
ncbi:unnamed protein product [Mytilus edulis]|uniref:Uncharacterized protein n=1 Tax=Mytilus edulis TaxID=6550 RepID=A0A8S3SMM7_MYTED|nr:unnamed protein product [Mytilus edulis]